MYGFCGYMRSVDNEGPFYKDFVITKLGSVCYFGTIYGEYTSAAKVPPEKTNSHESGF